MNYKSYRDLISKTPELENGYLHSEVLSFHFCLVIYRDETKESPIEAAVFRNKDSSIHSHTISAELRPELCRYQSECTYIRIDSDGQSRYILIDNNSNGVELLELEEGDSIQQYALRKYDQDFWVSYELATQAKYIQTDYCKRMIAHYGIKPFGGR